MDNDRGKIIKNEADPFSRGKWSTRNGQAVVVNYDGEVWSAKLFEGTALPVEILFHFPNKAKIIVPNSDLRKKSKYGII